VAKVLPDSPAAAADFQVGDIVVAFNGKDIARSSSLPPVVGSTPVGKKVPVKVIRGGRSQTLWVTLGELPDQDETVATAEPAQTTSDNRLNINVADLTAQQRKEADVEGGILVESVGEGAAADAGVRTGDVILRIDNKAVSSVDDFKQLLDKLPQGKSVAILVQRRGGPIFLALKVPEAG
jgi:serine protease Do